MYQPITLAFSENGSNNFVGVIYRCADLYVEDLPILLLLYLIIILLAEKRLWLIWYGSIFHQLLLQTQEQL